MIFLLAALVWQSDWNTAFAQTKQQHKLVFVDYYKAPCPHCFEIEHLVRDELGRALDDFVLLRVDLARGDVPPQYLYEPPAYVILDAGGRERLRIYDNHGLRADDWHGTESKKRIELRDPYAERESYVEVGGVIQP